MAADRRCAVERQAALTAVPGIFIDSSASLLLFYAGIVVETILPPGLGGEGEICRALVVLPECLVINLLLGIWFFKAVPDPYTTWAWNKEALSAMLEGKDRTAFP